LKRFITTCVLLGTLVLSNKINLFAVSCSERGINLFSSFMGDSINTIDTTKVKTSSETFETDKSISRKDTSNIYKAVRVNEELIDKFNRFLKENYPSNYESYFFNFDSVNYSDIESIREAWYKYLYGTVPDYYAETKDTTHKVQAANISQDSLKVDSTGHVENKVAIVPDSLGSNKHPELAISKQKKSKKTKKVSATTSEKPEKKIIANANTPDLYRTSEKEIINEGFEFQVQIAASREPLDKKVLNGIYSEDEEIHMNFENNWYKYSIGKYKSYQAARTVRDNSQVPGAFVVLFLNGKKVNIREAFVPRTSSNEDYGSYNSSENVIFKAQIAACRIQLPEEELAKIYNGLEKIEVIEEEGWFKYSINCGNNYSLAWKKALETNVPGVFIVAYQNGVRINIKDIIGNKN
jgi:hypothetical protein